MKILVIFTLAAIYCQGIGHPVRAPSNSTEVNRALPDSQAPDPNTVLSIDELTPNSTTNETSEFFAGWGKKVVTKIKTGFQKIKNKIGSIGTGKIGTGKDGTNKDGSHNIGGWRYRKPVTSSNFSDPLNYKIFVIFCSVVGSVLGLSILGYIIHSCGKRKNVANKETVVN